MQENAMKRNRDKSILDLQNIFVYFLLLFVEHAKINRRDFGLVACLLSNFVMDAVILRDLST